MCLTSELSLHLLKHMAAKCAHNDNIDDNYLLTFPFIDWDSI